MSAQVGEPTLAAALVAALDRAAASGTLLVACDYDGTLAPIVDDPDRAAPLLGAIDALADLAALPATWVSLVSGRSLDALVALACPPRAIGLIGSHGAERVAPAGAADREAGHDPAGLPRPPHDEAAQLLKELVAEVGAEGGEKLLRHRGGAQQPLALGAIGDDDAGRTHGPMLEHDPQKWDPIFE